MGMARTVSTLAALAGLATGQATMAQTSACMTEAEVNGLVTYALPVVMDSAIKTCVPSLSPQGYFATQGPALVQRYAARKGGSWPAAKAALFKLGGDSKDPQTRDMIAKLPDDALRPFAEGLVAQKIAEAIKPDQCTALERASRLLSPLPPENTAELLTFIVILAEKPKPGKKSPLPICPAQP